MEVTCLRGGVHLFRDGSQQGPDALVDGFGRAEVQVTNLTPAFAFSQQGQRQVSALVGLALPVLVLHEVDEERPGR